MQNDPTNLRVLFLAAYPYIYIPIYLHLNEFVFRLTCTFGGMRLWLFSSLSMHVYVCVCVIRCLACSWLLCSTSFLCFVLILFTASRVTLDVVASLQISVSPLSVKLKHGLYIHHWGRNLGSRPMATVRSWWSSGPALGNSRKPVLHSPRTDARDEDS